MLTRVFGNEKGRFSVHEIGCALGHFGLFLQERCPNAVFSGSDIIEPFVETCRTRFPDADFFQRDITQKLPDERYDFVVTCGLFH
ncbi:MAG: class I SAM-dependent methyltransferase, partial [Burkholderiales bacterium]